MEWFQQRKAGKVQAMLLDTCKRKQKKSWHQKAGRGKRISIIGAANKNAARYAKDYLATTRRTSQAAAKKPTANTTVYAVHVKPAAAAITGYVSFD